MPGNIERLLQPSLHFGNPGRMAEALHKMRCENGFKRRCSEMFLL